MVFLLFVTAVFPEVLTTVPEETGERHPPFLPQILPVLFINLAGVALDVFALYRLQSTPNDSDAHRFASQLAPLGFVISLSSALAYLSWFRLRK